MDVMIYTTVANQTARFGHSRARKPKHHDKGASKAITAHMHGHEVRHDAIAEVVQLVDDGQHLLHLGHDA
eukprot:1160915-Pelagomonas_calceolata.AAC.13